MKIEKQIENLIPKVEKSEKTKPRKKVLNPDDININKYKRHGSYRGDSPLDD